MTITRIQQRRGTAAEWTAANPVLAAGEEGVELVTGNHKTGDGVTPWNSLAGHGHIGTYAPLAYTRPVGETSQGKIDWIQNGDGGYLLHLTTGPLATKPWATIGIGVDWDGVGLHLDNKAEGWGFDLINSATITSITAYGMVGTQHSTAPLVYLQSLTDNVAPLLKLVCNTVAAPATQYLQEWQSTSAPNHANFAYDLGRVYATSGRFEWLGREIRANGSKLIAHAADTSNAALGALNTNAAWLDSSNLRLRTWSGSPGTWFSAKFAQGAAAGPHYFSLQAAQEYGHTDGAESWTEVIAFQVGKLGFYGVAPVVRAAAITSPTDPSAGYVQAEAAAMKTAVDAIRVALTNIGITS